MIIPIGMLFTVETRMKNIDFEVNGLKVSGTEACNRRFVSAQYLEKQLVTWAEGPHLVSWSQSGQRSRS